MAASSGCRLSVEWSLPIRGCSLSMMPGCIQTAVRTWWSAAVLESGGIIYMLTRRFAFVPPCGELLSLLNLF
ncbi:hypothetical protein D3Z47_02875 [Lachnospiraceae bacterium]|nr:hypothetical protein [Lachnospiraceae bacterium]